MQTLPQTQLEHRLFQFMMKLPRLSSEEHIKCEFLQTINTGGEEFEVRFVTPDHPAATTSETLEVATPSKRFGTLEIILTDSSRQIDSRSRISLRNSCEMLALSLERLYQDHLLTDKNFLLVEAIRKHTKELEHTNEKLRAEIEESRQVERRLTENQAFIHHVVEASPQLLYIYNLVDCKNEYANRELTRTLGYNREDLRQYGDDVIARILHPDDLPSAIEHHAKLREAQTDRPLDLIYRARHRNGSWRWLRSRDVPFARSEDGKVMKILGVIDDVTDYVHSEKAKEQRSKQLKQAQRMEAISSMAGGIAHDFNNILAAILGYAELAQLELADDNPVRSRIDEIVKAGNRAKELVKQIQAFSRRECMDKVAVKFTAALDEAIKLIRATLPKGVEIHTEIRQCDGSILADPSQIYQALLNLCTNAVQAMEGKGRLEIQLHTRIFGPDDPSLSPSYPPGSYLQLTIADNGHGIAKEYLERIFDPYFTTREFGKGSGMGLAIVAGIIKNHDGFIRVESSPRQGTAFHLFFPAAVDRPEPLEKMDERSMPTGREHILVVDDEESVASMTKLRLERLGYRVTAKTSSLEALETFRAHPECFDLVLTDQIMPEYTGELLAREIIELRPQIPIILCSGFCPQVEENESSLKNGIKRYLVKPVTTNELAETIRDVLDEDK